MFEESKSSIVADKQINFPLLDNLGILLAVKDNFLSFVHGLMLSFLPLRRKSSVSNTFNHILLFDTLAIITAT
jgi:hypothetical protein